MNNWGGETRWESEKKAKEKSNQVRISAHSSHPLGSLPKAKSLLLRFASQWRHADVRRDCRGETGPDLPNRLPRGARTVTLNESDTNNRYDDFVENSEAFVSEPGLSFACPSLTIAEWEEYQGRTMSLDNGAINVDAGEQISYERSYAFIVRIVDGCWDRDG